MTYFAFISLIKITFRHNLIFTHLLNHILVLSYFDNFVEFNSANLFSFLLSFQVQFHRIHNLAFCAISARRCFSALQRNPLYYGTPDGCHLLCVHFPQVTPVYYGWSRWKTSILNCLRCARALIFLRCYRSARPTALASHRGAHGNDLPSILGDHAARYSSVSLPCAPIAYVLYPNITSGSRSSLLR